MNEELLTPDPREAKQSVWVHNRLVLLRSALYSAIRNAKLVEAENDRLRGLIEGKFAGETDADTFMINDDTGAAVPLGKGPGIRFADFYGVRYGDARSAGSNLATNLTGGGRVLLVETDTPMQIRPTLDPCCIIIARAG